MVTTPMTSQDPRFLEANGGDIGIPVHPEYRNHINRWIFLIRSYLGGANFRMGQYLTRYVLESDKEYISRVLQTPYDNHVKSICHIYNSFLYRTEPDREFGNLEDTPELEAFLKDADFEGRSWNSFMRDVNLMSTIYGHSCVVVDRPAVAVGTRAEELEQGIRPFVSLFTPENILDWEFTRMPGGKYELTFLKLLEEQSVSYGQPSKFFIRTYTKDTITLHQYRALEKEKLELLEEMPNPLGIVPATFIYAQRSPIRGIGVSDIQDVADFCLTIGNSLSEIEQLIRLSNHPTLAKTSETDAQAGAGAIITMPNELDPGLKPYLLQPSGQSLESILSTIENNVRAIDRMSHMGAIRSIETRQMSGVAMMSEFLTLDAKLSEKAKNLELGEETIFRLFSKWQGEAWTGEIKYPMAFHIRDKNLDIDILKKAADTNPVDPRVKAAIDAKILDILEVEPEETESQEQQEEIQDQLMTGDSNEEIIEDNPGTTVTDIEAAAAAAAREN
jgi:hypothetical protein